ncbi:MAG: FtsX-like permease family protein [Pyrinomonadaceae bacterium]|jgi:putative ABC transport system permease protein|nr:FtsX-like permease family protein [Pyrinomonadaceae bacterium]
MNFIFNLIFREIRSSWKRLLFFFLCIAIGVGSVVALRSLIGNLSRAVAGDARGLLTADIEISSTSPFTPSEISAIEEAINKSKIVDARNEAITTSTMARLGDNIQFVELKGVESGFPLVGTFNMSDGKPFDINILENQGAIVEPTLLDKLNVKVGDKILIGRADFEIRGTFDSEPGGTSAFRAGPRVFIEKKGFDTAGLTRFGSRARRRILLRTTDDPTPVVAELRQALKGSILTVNSYKEAQENLGEQFERTENYLSLTGLLILVLGGIGVWNVARVFVEQKRKTVAILKCLGAKDYQVLTVYLMQILTLGLIGSFFGILLAQLALWLVKWRFAEALPSNMSYFLQTEATWQGIVLGVLISLLFSVLPLLQIRNIKPSLLLRDSNNLQIRRLDWTKWIFGFLSVSGLLGLAAWQAGSVKIGTAFLVSLFVTSAILYVSAIFLTKSLKKFKGIGSFSFSQAINSLYRPGNQTRVILLAVGLGAFVVLAVNSLQSNLVRTFDLSRNQSIPNLFIFDIQTSQLERVKEITKKATNEDAKPIPIVRMRIAEIDGEPVDFADKEMRQNQGQLGREFAVTYRPNLDNNESITEGKFWDGTPSDEPEISVAEDVRNSLKIDLGSYITFDVLGRRITAKVTSIRKFDIKSTRTAFVFVFRPGVLEKAPQIHILPIIKKFEPDERRIFQRNILDEFPNVQVFNVSDVIEALNKLIGNFVLAISFVGSFVILTGILILIGSVALTKSQRVYENAILKTLGAKRNNLLTILFTEYAILGLLAGIIGAFFATILSFVVTKYIFNLDWEFDLLQTIVGVLLTILLVTIIGVIASFGVIFKKPLATLRSQ